LAAKQRFDLCLGWIAEKYNFAIEGIGRDGEDIDVGSVSVINIKCLNENVRIVLLDLFCDDERVLATKTMIADENGQLVSLAHVSRLTSCWPDRL